MKSSSFKYLLKEGIKNLWSNRVMALTSVGILTTCLLIVGAAYLLTENVNSMVTYVEGQSEMSIFLNEFVPPNSDTENSKTDTKQEETTQSDVETPKDEDASTEVTTDDTATQNEDVSSNQETESSKPEVSENEKAATPSKYALNEDRITAVKADIEKNPNVKSCKYISKEQGLENTKEMLGDKGYLLNGIEDRNYIPDTFVITLKDVSITAKTKAELEQNPEVEIIVASTTLADTLTYMQRTITTMGSAIIIALGVISLVIISNTIRATIFARRKEVNIMKFVGATNSFIRIPFIVEGFVLGLIAAAIAYLLIWGSYSYLIQAFTTDVSPWLNSAFESIIPFKDIALNLALFFIITGTFLGSIGSVISIRNHVKV